MPMVCKNRHAALLDAGLMGQPASADGCERNAATGGIFAGQPVNFINDSRLKRSDTHDH